MPIAKGRYLYLPSSISDKDLTHLISGRRLLKERSDNILVFLHYIITHSKVTKEQETLSHDQQGFVQVSKKIRKKILGGDYQSIIRNLAEYGIIEISTYRPLIYNEGTYSTTPLEFYKKGKSCKQ